MYERIIFITYLVYLFIMSLISFILFTKDKRLAIKGEIRIKEKALLSTAILGGALGAFFGRIINHHKTNKIYFSIVIYMGMLLELGILALMGAIAFI